MVGFDRQKLQVVSLGTAPSKKPIRGLGGPSVWASWQSLPSTPQSFLAYMPKDKGDVATAAVNEWVMGLGKDEFVDQITHNVLKRFTA